KTQVSPPVQQSAQDIALGGVGLGDRYLLDLGCVRNLLPRRQGLIGQEGDRKRAQPTKERRMVPPQILQGHGGLQTAQAFVQHGDARGRDQSSLLLGRAGVWPCAEDQVGTAAV